MIYATDNDYGIPALAPLQGRAETPVLAWGSVSRGVTMRGTWHFYVDDYRFSTANLAAQVIATGCAAACEPNYTLYEQSPRWEVLAATARKRTVARDLQNAGIGIFVDLNVPERYFADCLLGVPLGWSSFSTRGYARRPEDLMREHARVPVGGTLLVIGGGKPVEALCRTLQGAIYVPGRHT
jgi:Domain of unknown function (DUF4417)